MKRPLAILGCLLVSGLIVVVTAAPAAITNEQRKELNQIRDDIGDVSKLIREKKYDEAGKLLDGFTTKLEKIAKDAELKPGDKLIAPVQLMIDKQKQTLQKQGGVGKGKEDAADVSFIKQIAPLLNSKCLSCHDEKAAGKLRLDSFAEMKKPSKSGYFLAPGQPQKSMVIARVTAPTGPQRMPKDAAALSNDEINLLANWIKQGAKFDGDDEAIKLSEFGKPATKARPNTPIKIAKATGNEKVKFIRDLAPDFVNICERCHSGNNPRGGFRTVTFEDLMRGGDSGAVLIAGKPDESRLWDLINGGPPKMPPGQARIYKKWYENLKVWIEEGCKFDGDDPKAPLKKYVPTEDELKLAKLSRMTADEFLAMRKEQTKEQWSKVLAKEESRELETSDFYFYGNVDEGRLKQLSGWADEHAKALRGAFKLSDGLIWKGKLAVIVYKDRFGYSEFSQTINNREPDPAIVGHSHIGVGQEEAYIVLQDVGDTANEINPDTRLNLIDQLTGAFLKREGKKLPEWLIRGTGLAMATKEVGGDNEFLKGLRAGAIDALRGIEQPGDLFNDGKFAPTDMAPIGFTLVSFMIREGSQPKFMQFVSALQSGKDLKTSVNDVYKPATTQTLATSYLGSLGNAPAPTKKKAKK
ncbi:MAG: c-type cytochrome domain-containing protein [Planctomycetaceae bacterium]